MTEIPTPCSRLELLATVGPVAGAREGTEISRSRLQPAASAIGPTTHTCWREVRGTTLSPDRLALSGKILHSKVDR